MQPKRGPGGSSHPTLRFMTSEARPRALQRCLANLLDNAFKYGGAAEISAAVTDGELRIKVRDHGPGIPVEQARRCVRALTCAWKIPGAPRKPTAPGWD